MASPSRVPIIGTPLLNADGSTNQQWWKFWARLGALFSTNGTQNASQSALNLVQGPGITLVSDAFGDVTISVDGAGPSPVTGGFVFVAPVAGVVTLDLSAANKFGLALAAGTAPMIAAPVNTVGAIANGVSLTLYLFQPASGSAAALPVFQNVAGGFVSNTAAQLTMDGSLGTETAVQFTFKNSFWSIDWQFTGKATS